MDSQSLPTRWLHRLALLALVALASVVFLGKAYETSLQAMDSSVHARIALETAAGGAAPILPMSREDLGGHWGKGFNDHPFTLFWINGNLMRFLGADAWSARLLPGLFSVGCVVLVYGFGAMLFTPAVGLVAGFILTTTAEFIGYGARFHLDTPLTFFILLSFIGWWRRSWLLTGLAVGLGLWVKSPVAFLVFPSALLALFLSRRATRAELRILGKAFAVAVVAGSLVWVITGLSAGWQWPADYWTRQVLGTAVGGRGGQQARNFWMFAQVLRTRYIPWLLLLLWSLVIIVRRRFWREPRVALLLSGALVVIVVISSVRFKYPHYYLPMYPFLALLCVVPIASWIESHARRISFGLLVLGLLVPSVLVATPIALSPEMFPALKRFDAIIQSYGSCTDTVLYVEGNQPYGSSGDYSAEVIFYTNRKFRAAECADVNGAIGSIAPAWILVSGDHLERCLSPQNTARYPVKFRFGNQWLLSRVMTQDQATDLTVLERELKAPLQCDPVEFPKNRYHRYR